MICTKKNHIHKSVVMLPFNYDINSVLFFPEIDSTLGHDIKKAKVPNDFFNDMFRNALDNNFNFYTDASKSGEGNYVGFAIYSSDWERDLILQYKLTSIASIFTGEALALN